MSTELTSNEVPHRLVPDDEFDALCIEVENSSSDNDNALTDNPWLYKKLGKYPARRHARKVAKELGVSSGIVYLPGQVERLYEDSDMTFEFRQRRYFYYLTGADVPGCAVTYDIGADSLILWAPRSDPRSVLWYGKFPTPDQYLAASDLDLVLNVQSVTTYLRSALTNPKNTLYVLSDDQAPNLSFPEDLIRARFDTTLLKPAMDRARVIKTEHEIALIRRANAISSGAHKAVLDALPKCRTEADVYAVYQSYCLSRHATRQAYPPIVASGANASTLHYTDNNQPLAGRQVLLLDAGAEWRCYASDVTRTFPLTTTTGTALCSGLDNNSRVLGFGKEAAAIYRAVHRMQSECIAKVKPGVPFYSLHVHACRVAVEELLRLRILRGGSVEDILKKGTVTAFFPHGLGHHVGLEVHDVSGSTRLLLNASLSSEADDPLWWRPAVGGRKNREILTPGQAAMLYRDAAEFSRSGMVSPKAAERQILEKNMVVTIEPGIYFCREYLDAYFLRHPVHSQYIDAKVLNQYWDVGGVRIEDDILVTEDGYENLTTAPKWEPEN